MKNVVYPDYDELFDDFDQLDHQEMAENISKLTKCLETLQRKIELFNSKTKEFIDKDLPKCCRKILSKKTTAKIVSCEISIFCETLISFVSFFKLPPKLLNCIANALREMRGQSSKFQPAKLTKNDKNKLLKFQKTSTFIRENHSAASTNALCLLSSIFYRGLFIEVKKEIDNKTLESAQFTELLTILSNITTFITPEYATVIVEMLCNAALDILKANPSTAVIICPFFANYLYVFNEKLQDILNLLCEIEANDSISVKYHCVLCISKIIKTKGSEKCADKLKEALFNAAKSKNPTLFQVALDTLPHVLKTTGVTLCDLRELVLDSSKVEGVSHLKIVDEYLNNAKITAKDSSDSSSNSSDDSNSDDEDSESKEYDMDKFAQDYLAIKKIYPPLNHKLVDKVSKSELRIELFDNMMEHPEALETTDFSKMSPSKRITNRIKKASQDSNDPTVLLSLSYYFLNHLDIKSLDIYLERLISKAKSQDSLIQALNNFTSKLNDFHSEEAYLTLLDECLKVAKKNKNMHHISSLFGVLCNWTEQLEDFPIDEVLEKIKGTNYVIFPHVFPSFLNKFIDKLSNREDEVGPFLMKFVETTIPVEHSNWLVQTLFRFIYTREELMNSFIDIVIKQLSDETKRINAVSLLSSACCIEADFYRINDEFCFSQKVIFLVQDETFEGQISLHPFHSARRIYFYAKEVIKQSRYVKTVLEGKIKLGQFILTTNDGLSDNILRFNSPLSILELNAESVLVFKVSFPKTKEPFFNVSKIIGNDFKLVQETRFLEKLSQESNMSSIFNMIGEEKEPSQTLVLILELFDNLKEGYKLPESGNNLQMILSGTVNDVLPYIDMPKIFAFVLAAFKGAISQEELHTIINAMITSSLDAVSTALACKILSSFEATVKLESSELKQCFLDCDSFLIRKAIVHFVDLETPKENFVSLLNLTIDKKYRNKTDQFFECISKFDIPKQNYIDLYKDMEQFEFSHYSDIDQTFIALMKLLPPTKRVIKLTLERLYTPPTCTNLNMPFVHTLESWEAALDFLKNEAAIPMLLAKLDDLPAAPSAELKLNDDFTHKGRLGIKNLGATCYLSSILQCLIAIPHITSRLFSTKPKKLPHFLQELRLVLAKLSFLRCGDISLTSLIENIKDFKTYIQQDAEEELNKILNMMKDDIKDKSIDLVSPITGKTEISYVYNSNVIKTVTEPFMMLQLSTKGMSNIYQAFEYNMKPQPIPDYDVQDGIKDEVLRCQKIVTWPDYLTLHLMRWDYSLENLQKIKLAHELDFPLILQGDVLKKSAGSDPGCNYCLTAIIVHSGTAEKGHYIAIVEGMDKDWYVCDDTDIKYFSEGQIPAWSFGGRVWNDDDIEIDKENSESEESANEDVEASEIMTAYLLIYRRRDLEDPVVNVPQDLEESFDSINAKSWPQEIYYSEKFVNYVRDLLNKHNDNKNVIELAIITIFKIIIIDGKKLPQICRNFEDIALTSRENCLFFFDVIERRINKSLSLLFGLTDASMYIGFLVNKALQMIVDTTQPLSILLTNMDANNGRRAFTWAYEFIATSLKTLQVDWGNEDEVLMLIVQYLTYDAAKDLQRSNSKPYLEAFSLTSLILNEVIENRGINDAVLVLFEPGIFKQLAGFAKKCESFIALLSSAFSQMPSLYDDIIKEAGDNKDVENLFKIATAHGIVLGEKMPDANFDFLFQSIPDLLFCEDENVRHMISVYILRLLKPVDRNLENFLKTEIFQKESSKPNLSDGVSTVSYFIGLTPKIHELIMQGKEEICGNAIEILVRCSKIAPKTVSFFTTMISECIITAKDKKNIENFITIIHSICTVRREEIIKMMSQDSIEFILSQTDPTDEAMQLLFIFKEFANKTPLSSACVERALNEKMSNFGQVVVNMINDGMESGQVSIPKQSPGIDNIKLALSLWDRMEDKRSDLAQYILSCLEYARPFQLYRNTEIVLKAVEILKEFAPEELNSIIKNQ